MPDNGTVTLAVISSGYRTIDVDSAEYQEAKAAGDLDEYLDAYLSDLDVDDLVFEPSGGSYAPSESPYGPAGWDAGQPEPLTETYGHVGRWLVRRTEAGFAPIGAMVDETLASYTAMALNAAAIC